MAFLSRCNFVLRNAKRVKLHRFFGTTQDACREMNYPTHAQKLGRWAGICSMLRLPVHENAEGLDACFVGIPFDSGTSYRSGTRLGPRQIRVESAMLRHVNGVTGASPFESMMVADIGDMSVVPFNVERSCRIIKDEIAKIIVNGCRPLSMGGDHLVTYPILQAMKEKYGKVGVIHIDSHADTNEHQLEERLTHGTPFSRAVEEDLLDGERVVQIGLRGSLYSHDDFNVAEKQGFRIVRVEECWHKSLTPLMEEVREQMGDGPVYLTFCVDAIDPAFAPGTGTLEIGGLTSIQALEIVRGCKGLNIIGADFVEVSPPYDPFGMTAHIAANLLFEMLCILPGVKYVK
ncbi:uncharacterized protein LOC114529359 [Dendronephthya gigantea]|uniref:uncharacterized protein LOC114529359 n=1 Tax=Dendronephthya gigantea TaxID=151771 RepID=UPI00106CE385|nr:uncharacterized protein LOC114529359 [Dendronephthya gigantea]